MATLRMEWCNSDVIYVANSTGSCYDDNIRCENCRQNDMFYYSAPP